MKKILLCVLALIAATACEARRSHLKPCYSSTSCTNPEASSFAISIPPALEGAIEVTGGAVCGAYGAVSFSPIVYLTLNYFFPDQAARDRITWTTRSSYVLMLITAALGYYTERSRSFWIMHVAAL